jgi:dCTP deaminase
MRLVDFQIHELCLHGMVVPFDEGLVNPASLDVRLGDGLLIESAEAEKFKPYPLWRHSKENPYEFLPGQFALAPTLEKFYLPDNIEAQFVLKSSRAREGLQHLLAGYCDPGWNNSVLTMELHNSLQLHPVLLWPGMKIGQMKFNQLQNRPRRSYAFTGRYNNDSAPQVSKG